MLPAILLPFADEYTLLNLFTYLTFRSGGAILTAFLIGLLLGPRFIGWLKAIQGEGQPIRADGPETHYAKQGTPTMGGLLILLAAIGSSLLWMRWSNPYVWITLFVCVSFGLVGFVDDFQKLRSRSSRGLSGRARLIILSLVSFIATLFIVRQVGWQVGTGLALPFVKLYLLPLSYAFFLFAPFVMVGSANAVNLTDGLDGLAIVPVMIATACLAIILYLVSHVKFATYLHLQPIPGAGEVCIICGAILGAGLAFLWYNAPPAAVFMGDVGSLSLGGALGVISIIAKHELVWAIIGGLFVLETVSVILQVGSFKLTGKRIFRMAPLHHHFEKKGWAESTVVIRFWIIAIVLALIGLATLKIR